MRTLTAAIVAFTGIFFVSTGTYIASQANSGDVDIPLTRAADRLTPLHFGLYVTPDKNPIPKAERFIGYHTGTDFEVRTEEREETSDVPVQALCDGNVLVSEFAEGYGGVLVQSCRIEGQDVTVLYGHLRPSSLLKKNATVKRGTVVGVLGKDHSIETDQNRRHLHLSIHKGAGVKLLGYVQSADELQEWLNPEEILFPKQDRAKQDAPLPGSSMANQAQT